MSPHVDGPDSNGDGRRWFRRRRPAPEAEATAARAEQKEVKQGGGGGGGDGTRTRFFGSQVGGKLVINYSYTDLPAKLLLWDARYFAVFAWALPWIVWPVRPCPGGAFDELAPTRANLTCVLVHAVLVALQVGFLAALPGALALPAWLALLAVAAFLAFNKLLCRIFLNGPSIIYHSDPEYAPAREEHAHEQWIFMNGVAVGEAWLKSNINRLALTFGRPVIGVHNQTSGILFDIVECLVQRNFGLATRDVREAYRILKGKLYDPRYAKVVFILHSQGGIEGGLVLDWLLQELPQDLLSKLEVYTFGNAANHFNNPHRHVGSQDAQASRRPTLVTEVAGTIAEAPMTDSPIDMRAPALPSHPEGPGSSDNSIQTQNNQQQQAPQRRPQQQQQQQGKRITALPAADRAIGHVEHYAHTTDFVALWGVLHFATSSPAQPEIPRFIGRVFSRTHARGGHQFSQHYLNAMFPLARPPDGGAFVGASESAELHGGENEFVDSVVEAGDDDSGDRREDIDHSWARLFRDEDEDGDGDTDDDDDEEVSVHGSFHGKYRRRIRDGKVRVRDLSRLWLYRNGRSPPEIPRGVEQDPYGLVRGATR